MSILRRGLAVFLAASLVVPAGFAGEVVKPEVPPIPAAVPTVLPKIGAPGLVPAEPAKEAPVMASLQAAQPGSSSDQAPKTGEAGAAEAGRPFTGELKAVSSPVAEPPAAPAVSLSAPVLEKPSPRPQPSRADLLDSFNRGRDEGAALKKNTIVTWVKSWAVIIGAPFVIKSVAGAFVDGRLSQTAAEVILGAGAVYGVWLMAKIVRLAAKSRANAARTAATVRELTKENPARTQEQAQKRLAALETEAARHRLAARVSPEFNELFTALRDYGVSDAKNAKQMDYLQRFLGEVRTGERDHWTLGSMSYHLLAGSEEILDELRARVWNDPAAGVVQVLGLEDHILALKKSLESDQLAGYQPGAELRFLGARMDEAYAALPRGVDLRRQALVAMQLQRLELQELREGRKASARGLRALRKSFHEELAVIGDGPVNEKFSASLAASNRARLDAVLASLRD